MEKRDKQFYITTPLYYVNSKPHIGHSYTQIACDAIARFVKQAGRNVYFMTGTDEHGEKIEKATVERGFPAGEEKRFVDEIVPHFKEAWKRLDITYDYFIRTTDETHRKSVQAALETLHEKGKIYKKMYKGWFCTPCETFWSDTQSPDGMCPDCKRPLEKLDETNYFLKISEYQKWLIEYIEKHPSFVMPDFRKNEVLGFLREPLLDLCISRPKSRMGWGIEIPFDRDFVTYVWFDALLNYISGAGYPHDMKRFERLWPCDIHVIGKDILRHHAVYWPIMLKALDIEPPRTVFAHGWWVIGGEKMSKSKGNVVDPMTMIDKYGVDAFRHYLLSAVRFGLDGAFSEERFVRKYNDDLANDLGNLVNRTLTMVEKYFGGVVPEDGNSGPGDGLQEHARNVPAEVAGAFAGWDFSEITRIVWLVLNEANKYIETSAPWKLAKEPDDAALRRVIYHLVQVLGIAAVTLYPLMPRTAQNVWNQLGMNTDITGVKFTSFTRKENLWGIIPAGTKTRKGKPLFPRITE